MVLYRSDSQVLPFYPEAVNYDKPPRLLRVRRFNSLPNITATFDNPAGKYVKPSRRFDGEDFWYQHYSTNKYNPWPKNVYPYSWRRYTYLKSVPTFEYRYPAISPCYYSSEYLRERNYSDPSYSYHRYLYNPSYEYDWPDSMRWPINNNMFRMRYWRALMQNDYNTGRNYWTWASDLKIPSYHFGKRYR